MPEMRQCAADSHREIRGESRAAVLGVFGVSEVPDDAKLLRANHSQSVGHLKKEARNDRVNKPGKYC